MARTSAKLATIGVVWVAVVALVAAADGFVEPDGPPWPIVVSVTVPVAVFVLALRTDSLRSLVMRLDHRLVVAVQLWRVVGVAFLFGWATDDLSAGFALPAGIGDVATGIAALAVLAAIHRDRLARSHLVWFTALGLTDFAVAITTGALLRPDGLEELPWILFPALAIPFFSAIHIVNWLQLAPLTDSSPVSTSAMSTELSGAGATPYR